MFPRLLAAFLLGALPLTTSLHAEPQWVWLSEKAQPNEKAVLRRTFTVPAEVKSARLRFSCDDKAAAFLNGKKAGESTSWSKPAEIDAAALLKAGENELRLEGQNENGQAGMLASLVVELANEKTLLIETGPDWEVAASGENAPFKPAVVLGKYGVEPWGEVFAKAKAPKKDSAKKDSPKKDAPPPPPPTLQIAAGFQADLLYTVPKADQGSWVSMTEDSRGRLIVCDQYGGLYRVSVPPAGSTEGTKVEDLPCDIGGAHGLLFAFDSLYVMVNEKDLNSGARKVATKREPGLYRLKYRAEDDQFDPPVLLRKCSGSGEHGPHGLALGPDKKSIYFANGNHTKLPEPLEFAYPKAVGEDHLLTRLWDPNGHARDVYAPGGYIGKIDPEGKRVEMIAAGFRNQYDIAFDANGELFTFDSDMEWDMGAPWYVPTRINHIVRGGDYGWRSGSGRWPAYYADSLPASVDIGPASPTGTVFGTGAKFPAKYQRALFALDWTYGTIWAIHFQPDGATYRGEKEDFLSGKAFSVTDALIRKADGAMYVTVGGRRNQSSLYRVTYTGTESTAPASPVALSPEVLQRRELESLQAEDVGPEAIEKAWPYLASPDRFLRFTARVVLEHQPVEKWADKALAETRPRAAAEALTALARVGDKSFQPKLLEALGRLDLASLPAQFHLPVLRAWELAFTRMGKPDPALCKQIAAKLEPLFPQKDPMENRELAALLAYLGSPGIVAKLVPLLQTAADEAVIAASQDVLGRNGGYANPVNSMLQNQPNRQAIAFAYALRETAEGWTPDLRREYFSWFASTRNWRGGNSFSKFIDNIRDDALGRCVPDPAERARLKDLATGTKPRPAITRVVPKGPGKAYTVDEVAALAQNGLKGRNFDNGKAMFASVLCVDCHHFGNEGGNIGPDLTGAGKRYSVRDLAENIIEPSKVISDQYGSEEITKKDGSTVLGRVVVEENGTLFVMTSGLVPDAQTAVPTASVKARKPLQVSMMPPGLINSLNENELLDMLAYLLSGGDPKDKAFQ